jgi:YD repeat-containing protein
VIDYQYDDLYRQTAADYSSGEFFHYTYDRVGNRLTQDTLAGTNVYIYDIANRLTSVDGVSYSWDDNGNLLSDGITTYSYDHANRLTAVSGQPSAYGFAYNGLGGRLRQTIDGVPTNYTLDLNAGLTQVLSDGTNTYLYGTPASVKSSQAAGRSTWATLWARAAADGCLRRRHRQPVIRALWFDAYFKRIRVYELCIHRRVGGWDGVGPLAGEVSGSGPGPLHPGRSVAR